MTVVDIDELPAHNARASLKGGKRDALVQDHAELPAHNARASLKVVVRPQPDRQGVATSRA